VRSGLWHKGVGALYEYHVVRDVGGDDRDK